MIVHSIKRIIYISHGKPAIINASGYNYVLNKRPEFVDKCRHQNNYLIKNGRLRDSVN